VQTDFVQSFLGRITDPDTGQYTDNGLLLLDDSSYRMVLSAMLPDPVLLHHQQGKEKALNMFQAQREIVRHAIAAHQGKEVLQEGPGIIGSFITAENAVAAASMMHEQMKEKYPDYRVHIHAGEPVTQHDKLFGDTLQFLRRMGFIQRAQPIGISQGVRELVHPTILQESPEIYSLSGADEDLLNALFQTLELQYAEPNFSLDDYAQSLAMSQSQLYRKTTALTGQSPNDLLKYFRLSKSRELLKKGKQNINEIAYDCGFNSPSYFTKCFKKEFLILPMDYLELI
jgi:AraC-like DNA-binding protein